MPVDMHMWSCDFCATPHSPHMLVCPLRHFNECTWGILCDGGVERVRVYASVRVYVCVCVCAV